jgi:hypothetical protein
VQAKPENDNKQEAQLSTCFMAMCLVQALCDNCLIDFFAGMAGVSVAENSSAAWNSDEQQSFLTMEDSGIDSDQKQQHVQEDGRLFTVRTHLLLCLSYSSWRVHNEKLQNFFCEFCHFPLSLHSHVTTLQLLAGIS